MAKVTLPERGQPLDLSLIYDLSQAVNDLYDTTMQTQNKYAKIDSTDGAKTSLVTDLKIIGGYKEVTNATTVNTASEQKFDYSFGGNYSTPPIVTATPINVGNTEAGANVSVVLKRISQSDCSGVVRFNSGGTATVGINLIIIGIPNTAG